MKLKVRPWVKIVFVLILLITTIFLYGRYYNTKGLKVKEYKIKSESILDNFYGFKIVHITDIHYKVTTDLSDLKKLVNEVNLLKPDIVVLTGDLFDSSVKYTNNDYDDLINVLKGIKVSIDKFAIKGDQDLNNDSWESVITSSGFNNLNSNYEEIYNKGLEPILLVGCGSLESVDDITNNIEKDYSYKILLIHEPDMIKSIDYDYYNLILAGHSLNGQIILPYFGGIIKPKGSRTYYKDYYKLNNTDIYISGGIGTGKLKFRFLNKPSINLYRLANK